MIDADKILKALQTDPSAALRSLGGQLASAGGAAAERLKTDPNARTAAMVGAGGLLAGMLAGSSSPKFGGAMARLGGLAAIGGLAYYAWRTHETQRTGAAPPAAIEPPPAGFLPSDDSEKQRLARLTLKAMINACKADGKIDSDEKVRLFDRLGQVDLNGAERDFLFEELARPIDTEGLIGEATTPALAAQIYAASLLAINPDLPAEKAYLRDLAERMGLPPTVAAEIHAAA